MASEPLRSELGHLFQRASFLEEVRCSQHYLQLLLGEQPFQRLPVHADHGIVFSADDQKRGRRHAGQGLSREVEATTARDDRPDLRTLDRRNERGAGPVLAPK